LISSIRNSVFSRVLWGFVAFYLLNISVDSADPAPEHIPEDLSFNDQESIIELVIEHILGFENAIKEYDDNDHGDLTKKKFSNIDLLNLSRAASTVTNSFVKSTKSHKSIYLIFAEDTFIDVDSPPPKV
jgi:hypothetical protein